MNDSEIEEKIKSNQGFAIIMAGSNSDEPHINQIKKALANYEVPHVVRICSAHKQPGELEAMIDKYNSIGGSVAYIAVAGGTDALSGTLSFHALGPVISCPPDTRFADAKYPDKFNETSLLNPPGSSNVYVARPANVGRFVAQLYAAVNPRVRELLLQEKTAKIEHLKAADRTYKAACM